ncbi:MAG: hypothetical protein H0X51_00225 [Parachlamydiaceae bacterium]|nr:hypothetical protein [Parachlamydiaceae bacterium]
MKFKFIILVCAFCNLLQSCTTVFVGIPCTVSYHLNHWRGNLEGKQFCLLQDLYLNQSKSEGNYSVSTEKENYSYRHLVKIIPKGSILTVVQAETNFNYFHTVHLGPQLFPKKVLAQYIDENDNLYEVCISTLFISDETGEECQFFANPKYLTPLD